MGYFKPFPARIQRGQRFGANPGWGPNPPGGHNGDDYLSQVGEPVYAAGDGVVLFAGQFDDTYADNFGWNLNYGGNMVVLNLDGASAPYVEYGHLSEVRVATGQRVRGAQVIALSGDTDGGAHVITGPHLHVGCLPPNFDLGTNTYGRVNPDLYLTDYPDENVGALSYESVTITPLEEDMPITDEDAQKVARFVLDAQVDRAGGGTNTLRWSLSAEAQRTEGIISRTAEATARLILNAAITRGGGSVGGETSLAGVVAYFDQNRADILNAVGKPSDAVPGLDPAQVNAAIKAGLDAALSGTSATITLGGK